MKLIAHRGNVDGICHQKENTQSYIDKAISLGYDVEIDIHRINDILFLGHDKPENKISLEWLIDRRKNLWVHTKNFAALAYLIDFDLRSFYHKSEDHTIINNCNLIWSHNLADANKKSIIPLLSMNDINSSYKIDVYGICSDFVSTLKDKI